ncbi:MAG: sensor domain-containing protein [Culicoidibacterales bacterium]
MNQQADKGELSYTKRRQGMNILYITTNQENCWISARFAKQIQIQNYQDVRAEHIQQNMIVVIDRNIPDCEQYIAADRFARVGGFFFICTQENFATIASKRIPEQYIDYLFAPVSDEQFAMRLQQWEEYQRKSDETKLKTTQLETLLDNIPYMAWFKNRDSEYIKTNQLFQQHSGKSMATIYGNSDDFVWDGAIGKQCREYDLRVMNQREKVVFEEVIPGTLGRRHFKVYKAPVFGLDKSVIGTIGIAKDITDALNEQSRGKVLIENLPFAVCLRDLNGTIIQMNQKYQQYVPNEARVGASVYETNLIPNLTDRLKIKQQDQEIVKLKTAKVYQTVIQNDDGEIIVECHKAPIFDVEGEVNGIIILMRDITEEVAQEKAIQKLAYGDSLTGLYNRSGLYNYLQREYKQPRPAAMFLIDLDNFKQLNDTVGHQVGNFVLETCAKRLKKLFPNAGIARDGGDEFTVIVPYEKHCDQACTVQKAQLLLTELNNAIIYEQKSYQISASIGIVVGEISNRTIDELLSKGETALQAAKQNGKQRIEVYTPQLDVQRRLQQEFIADFKLAIAAEEIELFYQPQYTCKHELVGFEALFRWQTPKYKHLNVLEMITMIEASSEVQLLGRYVMRKAMEFAFRINEISKQPLTISINVSAHQIMAPFFVQTVEMILAETRVNPNWIDLEITETVLLENIDANIAKLEKLRELGLKVSLDDFGTGYSSLNYLVKLPLSQVKIDRSFVCEITTKAQYRTLVKMIIEAAHSLHLPVVAEGVETSAELELLAAWEADYLQGYYFSPAIPEQQALKKIIEKEGEY